ncbi:MAG: peptidoglycan-binding domain-containing protein [Vampirovibrionales bacterium]
MMGLDKFYDRQIRPAIQKLDIPKATGLDKLGVGKDGVRTNNGKVVTNINEMIQYLKPTLNKTEAQNPKIPKGLIEHNLRSEYGKEFIKDKGTAFGFVGPMTSKHIKHGFHETLDRFGSPLTEAFTGKRFHEAMGKKGGPSMTVANIKPQEVLTPGVIQHIKNPQLRASLANKYYEKGQISPKDLSDFTDKGRDLGKTIDIMGGMFDAYRPLVEQIDKLPAKERAMVVSQAKTIPNDKFRGYQTLYWQGLEATSFKLKQVELVRKGLLKPNEVDGYNGPNTQKAIRAYEQKFGKLKPVVNIPDHLRTEFQGHILGKMKVEMRQIERMKKMEGLVNFS